MYLVFTQKKYITSIYSEAEFRNTLIRACMFSGLILVQTVCKFYQQMTLEDNTVKPIFSGHSKIHKTKILMTNGSLMKVKSIAEAFCNTFDLH